MGYFSFTLCDQPTHRLRVAGEGYLLSPDRVNVHETCYDGYGHFGGMDVYDMVADWNRQYMASHPDFLVPQHGSTMGIDKDGNKCLYQALPEKVSDFDWYEFYADLSLSKAQVVERVRIKRAEKAMQKGMREPILLFEYRHIGIDMASYDDQNAALPYPIKVAKEPVPYASAAASLNDNGQGFSLSGYEVGAVVVVKIDEIVPWAKKAADGSLFVTDAYGGELYAEGDRATVVSVNVDDDTLTLQKEDGDTIVITAEQYYCDFDVVDANSPDNDEIAIASVATDLLKTCTDDYATRIWNRIKGDVIADVEECSGLADGVGFSRGDVALAIGRALCMFLCPDE